MDSWDDCVRGHYRQKLWCWQISAEMELYIQISRILCRAKFPVFILRCIRELHPSKSRVPWLLASQRLAAWFRTSSETCMSDSLLMVFLRRCEFPNLHPPKPRVSWLFASQRLAAWFCTSSDNLSRNLGTCTSDSIPFKNLFSDSWILSPDPSSTNPIALHLSKSPPHPHISHFP